MVEERQRIDRWLWFARFAKTRTAAQKFSLSGRIRINRKKNDSAASLVRVGDILTIVSDTAVKVLRIEALGTRRGPASDARQLYRDLSTSDDA